MALNSGKRKRMIPKRESNKVMKSLLIQVNRPLYSRIKEEAIKRNITLRKIVTRAILNYLRDVEI